MSNEFFVLAKEVVSEIENSGNYPSFSVIETFSNAKTIDSLRCFFTEKSNETFKLSKTRRFALV